MVQSDFNLRSLYEALDQRRRENNLSWAAVAREVRRASNRSRAVSASTITSLQHKPFAEGDGILQMLLWLGRPPESFLSDLPDGDADRFHLPGVPPGKVLRWNAAALFLALDARRVELRMTWAEVARDIGGFSQGMLTNLAKGGRVGFPGVMRLVRWLGRPSAEFMRIADW